jgi:hypothetical protein
MDTETLRGLASGAIWLAFGIWLFYTESRKAPGAELKVSSPQWLGNHVAIKLRAEDAFYAAVRYGEIRIERRGASGYWVRCGSRKAQCDTAALAGRMVAGWYEDQDKRRNAKT